MSLLINIQGSKWEPDARTEPALDQSQNPEPNQLLEQERRQN